MSTEEGFVALMDAEYGLIQASAGEGFHMCFSIKRIERLGVIFSCSQCVRHVSILISDHVEEVCK